jgi:GAF domain-containing protein
MRSLETLRRQLETLGPSGAGLLPTLDDLEHEFELRARRIAALSTASHLISGVAGGGRGGAPVLDDVLMATLALSNAERSLIAVADDRPTGFRTVACHAHRGGADGWPLHDGAIASALAGESRLFVPELRSAGDGPLLIASFRSAMVAPIVSEGRTLGALYVDLRGPSRTLSDADFETFRLFARHASVALALALQKLDP